MFDYQCDLLLQLAKKIAERDKATFDTLIEFERTGKIRTKTHLNFTIDKSLAQHFKKFCRNHGYNMSAKIERALKGIMEQSTP